jgi:hypothetical protein
MPAEYFHPEQLFQPHIRKRHLLAEVAQQRELARLVRRLEYNAIETECAGEAVGRLAVEPTRVIEDADAGCAFPRFDDEVDRSRVEPRLPEVDEVSDAVLGERAAVFLSELELEAQAEGGSTARHVGG